MSVRLNATKIREVCDAALSHPNLCEVENNPAAGIQEFRHAVDELTESIRKIWALANQILGEARD